MQLNLIRDPWIQVDRRSGEQLSVAPWQITDDLDTDPVARLASPRPDFDGALAQLLIGLLQATIAPKRDSDWRRRLEQPPTGEELRSTFEPIAHAFELVGDGPRFLQDLELQEDEAKLVPIEKLLIDHGLSSGSDLFVRTGQTKELCLPCAAAALATLQSSAPSGGRGHRTSMRGGGPLTTLVLPGEDASLWEQLWWNVLPTSALANRDPQFEAALEHRFPWLAPTRTSESSTGTVTTPLHADALQMYFGMPRRIRLHETTEAGRCAVCGQDGAPAVSSYLTKDLGVNYDGPWKHPLTPYRTDKKTGMPISLKGRAARLCYRDWLSLAFENGPIEPAAVVRAAVRRFTGGDSEREPRIWAFGYAMDNMKPRAWCEGKMPLVREPRIEVREALAREVERLIGGALQAERALIVATKKLIRRRFQDVKGDLSAVSEAFWSASEADFYSRLRELHDALRADADTDSEPLRLAWHRKTLVPTTKGLFERQADRLDLRAIDPYQVAEAWNGLLRTLHGKKLLTTLALPPPKKPTKEKAP